MKLAGSTIDCRCHACAFFDNRDEEYAVLLPFMKEGLEAGDKAALTLDQQQRAERLRRLGEAGVDPEVAEQLVSSRCAVGRMHTCGPDGSISTP